MLAEMMKYKRSVFTKSLLTSTCKTQHRGGQLNIRRMFYIHSEQRVKKRPFTLLTMTSMFSTSSRCLWSQFDAVGAVIFHWPTIKYCLILPVVTLAGWSFMIGPHQEWARLAAVVTIVTAFWVVYIQLLCIRRDKENPLTGEKPLVLKHNADFEYHLERYFRSTIDIVEYRSPLHVKAFNIMLSIMVKNSNECPHMQSLNDRWSIIPYHSSHPQPIHAFSSGSIYIPTYLLKDLSEDELTFLISHAMASVLMDTQRKKYAETALDDSAMLFIHSFTGFFQVPIYGLTTVLFYDILQSYFDTAPVDQKAVLLADKYALEFTARTCRDIRKIPVYIAKLAEIENESRGRRGLYKVKNSIRSDPTFEKRRENIMSHMGETMRIYSDSGCPKLDPENDPIVDYEIAEFERNREARKRLKDKL